METTPNFEELQDVLALASRKQDIRTNLNDMVSKETQSLTMAFGDKANRSDFVQDNLKPYSLQEIKSKCSHPADEEFIDSIFTDSDGNLLEPIIEFDSKYKKLRFKADLLLYLKVTQEGFTKIEEEERKLDEATRELNANIEEVCAAMSDNVIAFIDQKKDEAEKLTDDAQKAKILKMLNYIESGYTFELIKEPYLKYPNAAYNALKEFNSKAKSRDILHRYKEKCLKLKSTPALINLFGANDMSFEERFLFPEDYKEKDLFIYTLIRFFSMATTDDNFKRLHSTTCVMINKLMKDEMPDLIKERYLNAVKSVEKIYM